METSVRLQLIGAFGVLVALLLLVTRMSTRSLPQTQGRYEVYVNEHSRLSQMAARLRGEVNARAIAARNLVLVTGEPDRAKEYQAVNEAHEGTQRSLEDLQTLLAQDSETSEKDRAFVREIVEVESLYGPVALDVVSLAVSGKREAAVAKTNKECRPLLARLLGVIKEYLAYSGKQASASVAEAYEDYSRARSVLLAFCALAVSGAVVLGALFLASLSRALGTEPAELRKIVQRTSAGDLSPVPGAERARSGSVMASLGTIRRQLIGLIAQVRDASRSIAEASEQITRDNVAHRSAA